jgi:hypothetical protein
VTIKAGPADVKASIKVPGIMNFQDRSVLRFELFSETKNKTRPVFERFLEMCKAH